MEQNKIENSKGIYYINYLRSEASGFKTKGKNL